MSVWRAREGRLLVMVRVTPNASRDGIAGLWRGPDESERLAVRVTAPPDRGRANQAVAKLLAKTLGLPKSAVSIVAGDKDRLKTVAIDRDSGDIIERLEALAAEGREND